MGNKLASPAGSALPTGLQAQLVGYTGPRAGMTEMQQASLITWLMHVGAVELHHGDCVGGDAQAHGIARNLALRVIGHPPTGAGLRARCHFDDERTPLPYLIRNQHIVIETSLLIGTPETTVERLRSGTWSTIRFARQHGNPYVVIYPDGSFDDRGLA